MGEDQNDVHDELIDVTNRLNQTPETHATNINAFDCYTKIINKYKGTK